MKYKRKTKDVKCRKCDRETRVPVEDRLKDISCRCGGRFRLHSRTRNLFNKTTEQVPMTTAVKSGLWPKTTDQWPRYEGLMYDEYEPPFVRRGRPTYEKHLTTNCDWDEYKGKENTQSRNQ